MAPQKRKRQSIRNSSLSKRTKYDLSSSAEDDFWEAECILAERRARKNNLEYHIKWKGIDPATGRDWAPTWEPASNVNRALLDEWLKDKAGRRDGESAQGSPAPESNRTARIQAQPRPRGRPVRKPHVIASSPKLSSPSPSTTTGSTRADPGTVAEPQPNTNITADAREAQALTSPQVLIGSEVDSVRRAEYERYSQLLRSQAVDPPSAPATTQQTDLDSFQLFAAARNFSSGIVPDSQSSAGEASYVSTTQASASVHTTQHTGSSPEEEEAFAEDSGLLEIIHQAASRAASPVQSIPETINETTQDLQSQAQEHNLQEQTEISDTFERIESSFPSPQTIAQQDPHEQEQSVTVLQHSTDSELQGTAQVDHVQGEVAQQEPTQEEQPGEIVPQGVQETAAQQEAIEKDIVANDATLQTATHHETTSQERELRQVSERTSLQATTEVEDTGTNQQRDTHDALQQDRTLQEANPQQAIHREDKLLTQQETIRAETAQQNTTQPESLQSDLAGDTLHPAQDVHQSTFVDSENQDTAHLSASTQALNVAPLDQLTSAIASPSAELSIDIANIVGTEDLGEAPERQTGAGESDTPVQVPEAFAQPTCSPQATPHTEQARAQTPNTAASLVQDDTSCITDRRNSADISQPLLQLEQSVASPEQNAQLVPSSTRMITQEYTTESIRLTIEIDPTSGQTSPNSRHDSSQESPKRCLQSLNPISSPIAPPPSHSFGTLSQNVPPRPLTPHVSPSSSTMANTNDTAKKIRDRINESKARARSENPFVPRSQRHSRSTLTPSAPASEASVSSMQPKKTSVLPGPNVTLEGTRSPSTVPDHSPAPQAPTSLRTVAFANSREIVTGEARKEPIQDSDTGPRQEHAEFVAAVAARAATSKTSAPSEESMQIDDEESSDIDDDGSVLNDDLQLESGEYIVPLFIEGRQSDMYLSYIKDNRELLENFLKDPESFEPVGKVEEVLSRMRAIETHIDLVYAEAESASRKDIESAARFGIENSTKFKFLHTLFMSLQDEDKHIVLVTEDDSDALYSILETFCKAGLFNCSMPTKGRRASSEYPESRLLVTAFPSTASPIIQAASLIICLDGVQSATKIQQKNWAAASGRVPIIHLVLPRSIGHIERYMSSTLDNRERMNTIIASLAQIRPDIGKPIDEDTPQASAAAKQIANWIMIGEDNGESSWPLPSIGSVKAVIEFQTQRSPSSSESSALERTKRPLENDNLDQAKRMRFTPQPQVLDSTYSNNEDDTTRISNSIPDTSEKEVSWLQHQLEKERAARKAEEERFCEHESMWNKQQEEHESLVREHRLLLGKQKDTEEKLESVTKSKEKLQERLLARTTEKQTLELQLKEQQAIGLASSDDMVVEMTRVRMDLAAAQEERQKALKSLQTTEATHEYTKEQYRAAQDTASRAQAAVDSLTKENVQLRRQASGEAVKLKQTHHNQQFEQIKRQYENQRAEVANLKRLLGQKEEEVIRAKNNMGRIGVGTRAQSATPAPKTRSRAASPMRMSNLRNG